MSASLAEPVFSLPLDHFRRASVASIGCVEGMDKNFNRPTGLKRFVGDEPNQLLKVFAQPLVASSANWQPGAGHLVGTSAATDPATHLTVFAANEEADSPPSIWETGNAWPLVLFGPSGTGKTSLALTFLTNLPIRPAMNAQQAAEQQPAYLTALDFDRRYRGAMETDSVADFRASLVRRSGLLIDNLHELATKPAAQHEIVLLIEAMVAANRPILFTLHDSPYANGQLVPQLVSRLGGGLSLPISPPGIEARYEIVRDLAELHGLRFTAAAIELLVNRLSVTVPGINHFMLQFKTSLQATGQFDSSGLNAGPNADGSSQPLDIECVVRWMNPADDTNERTGQLIAKRVAKAFGVKKSDLSSQTRKQTIVMARGVAIYLIRSLTMTSFKKIGGLFGNRDHSTIMHAYRKLETIMSNANREDERAIRQTVQQLKQELAEQLL